MRRLAVIVLVLALALATSCKKDSSKGLPPASDWSAQPQGSGQGMAPAAPASPHASGANPHDPAANPHGPAANPPGGSVDPGGGAMPQQTEPRTLEKLPDGRLALGPFSFAAPAGWTQKPITSSMRAAHFALPAAAGAEAELVIFYFGEEGAGSVEDNLDRWLGQFQQPDGKPSKSVAKIEKAKFAGQEATVVSVTGRYVTTMMPGGGGAPIDKTDQALIGAIVASPKGPYYFKLVGAKKTIDAEAPKFRAMLASLKLR
jgi:hypothetical protein